jgi:type I restriction-modification system DNA methylase subunit
MQALLYRKLSELVERFNTERSGKRSGWVKRLFESLDWGHGSAFTIESENGQGFRLLVDNFPMVNVLVDSPNNIDPVYSALNRAYNQDVPWVVATDFQSLGVFGSYWVSFPHDVSAALALRMESSEYVAEAHNLEILTAHAVAQNTLNELYDSYTGRKRRVPIDLHFIERMVQWRQLVLNALGPSSVGSDKLIHRLINTLFLIRYLEDCRLTQDRLLEIANESSDVKFTQRLRIVFDETAVRTGYSVPTKAELADLQQAPLRDLLKQLYGYPDYGVNYDFAAMNVDILGRFYEEYLRKDVVPADETRAVQMLFEPPTYRLEDVRRQHGIYFTPRFIVDYILNNLIGRFRDRHVSHDLPFILDLAAGSGTFLSAAVDHLGKAYRMRNGFSDIADHLIGLDADPRAIEAARLNLTAKLLGQALSKRPPNLKLDCVDLIGGPGEAYRHSLIPPDGADIIVGNPPFIKYEWLKERYHVPDFSARFETATGRTDSYIMFVEAAVKLLREGGYGGLVLPNNILRTKTAGALRNWLSKHVDVLEIIDFLDQRVFQGVSAYVCILLFRKRSTEKVSSSTMVARIHEISDTPASQLASLSVAQSDKSLEGSEVFWADQPSGRGPWNLRNRTELELLELLREVSDDSVGSALNLRQGIKTGADPIFIVEGSQITEGLYLLTGQQKPHAIERDLLIPVLRNRDLRRWGSRATAFLIYPYDRDSGKLLPWKTIETNYPRTAAYLEAHKMKLSGRRSLRGRKKWYELIEPRFQTISSDMPSLAAAEISLRPVISKSEPPDAALVGNAWLTLKNEDYDLDIVMTYLNSAVAEWYLRQVSPLLQGGYILLRQTNLSRLPVPRFLKASDTFARDDLKRLAVELVKASTEANWRANPTTRNEIESAEERIDILIMEELRLKSSHADQIRRSITLARQIKHDG